jgi:hypothetical protein
LDIILTWLVGVQPLHQWLSVTVSAAILVSENAKSLCTALPDPSQIGLVLVDRNTVTVGPCDVNISFGAHPCEITGTVRFLHPLHNFAVVSYEVSALPPEARSKVGGRSGWGSRVWLGAES